MSYWQIGCVSKAEGILCPKHPVRKDWKTQENQRIISPLWVRMDPLPYGRRTSGNAKICSCVGWKRDWWKSLRDGQRQEGNLGTQPSLSGRRLRLKHLSSLDSLKNYYRYSEGLRSSTYLCISHRMRKVAVSLNPDAGVTNFKFSINRKQALVVGVYLVG